VIGAGPAGEKAAAQAAFFGKRVAIVERRAAPGGALVSSAGVPTKTLRETALYLTGYRRREVYGLSIQLDPDATLDRLMDRAAQVQAAMAGQVRENIARHQIEMVPGTGSFGPNRTVGVTPGRGMPDRGRYKLASFWSPPDHGPFTLPTFRSTTPTCMTRNEF
jgi:NAD(P) transhydrogenase